MPSSGDRPAPAASALEYEEAHRRAPTLMSGVGLEAGSGVRIWRADTRQHLKTYLRIAGVTLLLAAPLPFLAVIPIGFILVYTLMLIAAAACAGGLLLTLIPLRALEKSRLWRLCYIATDDTGIAVNTFSGSLTLRWDEILGYFEKDIILERLFVLYTSSHDQVPIELWGFSPSDQKELISLIKAKAQLLDPTRRTLNPLSWCHMRQGCKILPGGRWATSSSKSVLPAVEMPTPPLPASNPTGERR